jgi:hypothetical protein
MRAARGPKTLMSTFALGPIWCLLGRRHATRSNDGCRDFRGVQDGRRKAKWAHPRKPEPPHSHQPPSETTSARFATGFSDGLRSWSWWGVRVGATVASECMTGGSCVQGLQVPLHLQTGSCRVAAFLLTIYAVSILFNIFPSILSALHFLVHNTPQLPY